MSLPPWMAKRDWGTSHPPEDKGAEAACLVPNHQDRRDLVPLRSATMGVGKRELRMGWGGGTIGGRCEVTSPSAWARTKSATTGSWVRASALQDHLNMGNQQRCGDGDGVVGGRDGRSGGTVAGCERRRRRSDRKRKR